MNIHTELMGKSLFLLLMVFFISSCDTIFQDYDGTAINSCRSAPHAKNIILVVGDGMGEYHRKTAQWRKIGQFGSLAMDDMPVSGYSKTGSANSFITDSAAAATALSTGEKTNNDVIGLDPDLNILTTILEEAQSLGKAVGLVTTTQITHATPAAFAAHVESRDMMTEIASQMLSARVDVLLGGGESEFLPTSETGCYPNSGMRTDSRNLINEAITAGYTYICDSAGLTAVDPAATTRLLGLFADEGMSRPFTPSLTEMVRKAVDILSMNPTGFFLMVEGGQIDWASHSNDSTNAINDTIELDAAVEVIQAFAGISDETLIIVTADHETGGMTAYLEPTGNPSEDGPFQMPDLTPFYIDWSSSDHTSSMVPTTAQGPSSKWLTGEYENTYIYTVMHCAQNGIQ